MDPLIDLRQTEVYRRRSASPRGVRVLHRACIANSVYLITLLVILDAVLVLARRPVSQTPRYPFIPWNLFLAGIPYGVSLGATLLHHYAPQRRWLLLPLSGLWLLFLPNAPYLLTDFSHLQDTATLQIWFDTTLLTTYAVTGYMLALVSLDRMHRLVRDVLGWHVGWLFVAASLVLAGIGVRLGRVQRYNSWDILIHPKTLLADILTPLFHPFMHPQTTFNALYYATILLVGYVAFLALRSTEARAIIWRGQDARLTPADRRTGHAVSGDVPGSHRPGHG